MRYAPKRTIEWSADLAYAVGLLASDGGVSKDGRHIGFTSKDLQLAQTYRSIVKPSAKIGVKSNGRSLKEYYRVDFSDVCLYDFLVSIGIGQRKSLTIQSVAVPEIYYADFFRGCFDGDGSIYSFWDKRWKSSFMFYLTIASASRQFLSWLQNENLNIIDSGLKGSISVNGDNVWQLKYAKKDARILFDRMYYTSEVPCLKRKYDRFIEFFVKDEYA